MPQEGVLDAADIAVSDVAGKGRSANEIANPAGADLVSSPSLVRPGMSATAAATDKSARRAKECMTLGESGDVALRKQEFWKGSGPAEVESESQYPPLLFPTPTDSDPPSPDPLRPSSPLRWRLNAGVVSPVSQGLKDTHVVGTLTRDPTFSDHVDETPVRGVLTRDPTFSDHTHGRTLFHEEQAPATVERKLLSTGVCKPTVGKAVARDRYEDGETLDAFLSCIAANGNNLDYSVALEYTGPPVKHAVPKVEPLGPRHADSNEETSAPNPIPVSLPTDPKSWVMRPPSGTTPRPAMPTLGPHKLPEKNDPAIIHAPLTSSHLDWSHGHTAPLEDELYSPKRQEGLHTSQSRIAEVGNKKKTSDPVRAVLLADQVPEMHAVHGKISPRVFPAPVDSLSQKSSTSLSHDSSVANSDVLESGSASISASVSASVSASEYPSPTGKLPQQSASSHRYNPENFAEPVPTVDAVGGSARQLSYRGGRSISLPLPASSHHSKSNSIATDFSQQLVHAPLDEESPPVFLNRKKRECHRCSRGNRFTEKESCLVCGARYCSNCVLTAMGSMPEGRKCTGCIGEPIHETKRKYLGKCSRLLGRLLSPLEIQQIMKAERESARNQLQPHQIIINMQPLSGEELADLLTCDHPPVKLKPGRYWYDPQSGLWGKQGENPDQIISSHLKFSGTIQRDASNGHTGVRMNDRELGKWELKIYKMAGVHCPPGTHLWVDDDGSYREEGQKEAKGNIWEKPRAKLLYPFFSLPIPHAGSKISRSSREGLSGRHLAEYLEPKRVQKLLLLGHEGSGRSTVFKQAKYLFKEGFSPEELQEYKSLIQSNAYKYISILLEGRERFEDADSEGKGKTTGIVESASPSAVKEGSKNIYALDPTLKKRGDWFLEIMANGDLQTFFPAATREYAPVVEELWHDPAIQATFKRKDELHMLPDVAGYFLEKVGELSSNEYEPSEDDILAAEGLIQGSGLAQIEFVMEDKAPLSGPFTDAGDSSVPVGRYQLIRVGGVGVSEGKKWLDMFEDVCAVIFCVSLSDYDEFWPDNNGVLQNKLVQSKELFESILLHPCFRDTPFVLLLNKRDVFEEKICKGIPLSRCEWLSDFDPLKSVNSTPQGVAHQAYHYVVHKFKEVYTYVNNAKGTSGYKILTFELNARDRSKVNQAFMYIKDVLKWEEDKSSDCFHDSFSTDTTSSFYPSLSANHPAFYDYNNVGAYPGSAGWVGRTI